MTSVETNGADSGAIRVNKLELVERLADDLAHEIKNPLHSMVINLEVLKRRLARSADAEVGEWLRYVGVVAGELERVNRRVDLLLRMVRPDRRGEPVTLAEAVEEIEELLALEGERLGVALEYHASGQPVLGRIPHGAARQIVLNLVLAALDGAGPGSTVTVATEAESAGERIHVRVAPPPEAAGNPSAGSGVEEEDHHLAIVRALAETLGARLVVEGGDGAELVLFLPASAAQA